jgi:hypothetical protein
LLNEACPKNNMIIIDHRPNITHPHSLDSHIDQM